MPRFNIEVQLEWKDKKIKEKVEVILHMMESVMNEQKMAANCGSNAAKWDNEDKADIIVPFVFFFSKPLLLFFLPT